MRSTIACAVCWVATVLWATGPAPGQTAASLRGVRRIYVEPFPEKPGAQELRAGLIAALKKSRGITVAASRQDADAVITAKGETWIRGYYSLNPRVRSVTSDTHPIYGGYLSVELKGRESETLWSYLVTPRHPGDDVAHVLGSQMARKLMEALK